MTPRPKFLQKCSLWRSKQHVLSNKLVYFTPRAGVAAAALLVVLLFLSGVRASMFNEIPLEDLSTHQAFNAMLQLAGVVKFGDGFELHTQTGLLNVVKEESAESLYKVNHVRPCIFEKAVTEVETFLKSREECKGHGAWRIIGEPGRSVRVLLLGDTLMAHYPNPRALFLKRAKSIKQDESDPRIITVTFKNDEELTIEYVLPISRKIYYDIDAKKFTFDVTSIKTDDGASNDLITFPRAFDIILQSRLEISYVENKFVVKHLSKKGEDRPSRPCELKLLPEKAELIRTPDTYKTCYYDKVFVFKQYEEEDSDLTAFICYNEPLECLPFAEITKENVFFENVFSVWNFWGGRRFYLRYDELDRPATMDFKVNQIKAIKYSSSSWTEVAVLTPPSAVAPVKLLRTDNIVIDGQFIIKRYSRRLLVVDDKGNRQTCLPKTDVPCVGDALELNYGLSSETYLSDSPMIATELSELGGRILLIKVRRSNRVLGLIDDSAVYIYNVAFTYRSPGREFIFLSLQQGRRLTIELKCSSNCLMAYSHGDRAVAGIVDRGVTVKL